MEISLTSSLLSLQRINASSYIQTEAYSASVISVIISPPQAG